MYKTFLTFVGVARFESAPWLSKKSTNLKQTKLIWHNYPIKELIHIAQLNLDILFNQNLIVEISRGLMFN